MSRLDADSLPRLEAFKIINQISPRPKLGTIRARKRKSESAAILTSSPYKKMVEEKQAVKQKPVNKKIKAQITSKGKASKIKSQSKAGPSNAGKTFVISQPRKHDTTSEKDVPCLVCSELFSNSRPRAQWIQCEDCGDWAHVESAKFGPRGNFGCDLCDD